MTMVKHHSKPDAIMAARSSPAASVAPHMMQDAQVTVTATTKEFSRADSASARKIDSINVENEPSHTLRNGPFPQMSGFALLTQHGMIRKKKLRRFVVLQGSALGYAREEQSPFEREMTIKKAKPGKRSGEIIVENTRGHQWTVAVAPDTYQEWLDALLHAQHRDLERFYRISGVLGSGAYSTVMECEDKSNPQQRFAVKIIQKKDFDMQDIDLFRREVRTQIAAAHPRVVRIVDVFENEDVLHICMEIMKADLFALFSKEIIFSESQAQSMLRDILQALCHIHKCGILHRDVKPENLFANSLEWPLTLKLGDFGLSRFYNQNSSLPVTSFVGTSFYVAPEVIMELPYGPEIDLWSAGVILYEALSGVRPFDGGKDEHKTLELVKQGEIGFDGLHWRNISEQAKNMIKALLQKDVDKRLTALAALHHPWLDPLSSDSQLFMKRMSTMSNSFVSFSAPDQLVSKTLDVRGSFRAAVIAVVILGRFLRLQRQAEARQRMQSSNSGSAANSPPGVLGHIGPDLFKNSVLRSRTESRRQSLFVSHIGFRKNSFGESGEKARKEASTVDASHKSDSASSNHAYTIPEPSNEEFEIMSSIEESSRHQPAVIGHVGASNLENSRQTDHVEIPQSLANMIHGDRTDDNLVSANSEDATVGADYPEPAADEGKCTESTNAEPASRTSMFGWKRPVGRGLSFRRDKDDDTVSDSDADESNGRKSIDWRKPRSAMPSLRGSRTASRVQSAAGSPTKSDVPSADSNSSRANSRAAERHSINIGSMMRKLSFSQNKDVKQRSDMDVPF